MPDYAIGRMPYHLYQYLDKGVSFMENQAGWHGKAPNDEQYEQAKAELEAKLAELEGK